MTSAEIRNELARRVGVDFVGPPPGHAFGHELLPGPPNQWYLSDFLIFRPAKGIIEETRVRVSIQWLRDHELVPTGRHFQKPSTQPELFDYR